MGPGFTVRRIHLNNQYIYKNETSTLTPFCKTTRHLITSTKCPKIDQKSLLSIRLYGQSGINHLIIRLSTLRVFLLIEGPTRDERRPSTTRSKPENTFARFKFGRQDLLPAQVFCVLICGAIFREFLQRDSNPRPQNLLYMPHGQPHFQCPSIDD